MRNLLTIELVLGALLVTSYTCVGLAALWAAMSPRHWFLRAAVVFTALSPLLLVPALELFLVFALQAVTIVTGVAIWNWPSDNLRRFSLRALFLFTLVIAVASAVGTHIAARLGPQTFESWTTILLNGFASGLAVLLAAWMIASSRRVTVWPVAGLICLGLTAALAWFDWLFPSFTLLIDFGWPPDPQAAAGFLRTTKVHPQLAWLVILPTVMLLALVVIALWLMTFTRATADSARPNSQPRSSPRLAGVAVALLVALITAFPLFVLWKLLHPLPPPTFATPDPNGFDQITIAVREFDNSAVLTTRAKPQSVAQLAAEVAKYANSYDKLRVGLSQDIQVRKWPRRGDRSSDWKWLKDTVQSVTRGAARPMMMEAELARWQGRHSDAVRISLEIRRLGLVASRDGNFVDYLVGIAMEGVAQSTLYPSIEHLSTDECRAAINALIDFDRAREPLEPVFQRDRIWHQNMMGWHGHLWQILDDIAPSPERLAAFHAALRRIQALSRLLLVELALRAYRSEHGTLPEHLDQLTPALLDQIPIDPCDPAGGKLRYIRTPDGYVLYSVGVDGRDNGGLATSSTSGLSNDDTDLRLDKFCGPDPPPPATPDADLDTDNFDSASSEPDK
jgi:hypothetical protein